MLSPGLNELKLFDFPLCLKMEPAKSGDPGIFLQYTQPVKLSSNIRIPGHIVIERKPQWLRAPSITSWTSADKVENKFGSNPLYLTKTKLISTIQRYETGPMLLPMLMNCKKNMQWRTQRLIWGQYVFIFTIGFNTREQTSIRWDWMQR